MQARLSRNQVTVYLVTGANGFLGQIIVRQLEQPCETLSRSDATYRVNLAREIPQLNEVPEVALHIAGKAHSVPKTEREAQAFFDVNLLGTQNLVKGLERLGELPRAFLFISTVAVYGVDKGTNIPETHPLQGDTPYALSKIQAEAFLEAWGEQKGVRIGILRLPLIAGPNPPGNLGAMIRGIQTGKYLRFGQGATRKSVVLAQDIASVLPALAERGGTYNLTDGYHPSFAELENEISRQLGKSPPRAVPLPVAHLLGKVGDVVGPFPVNSSTVEKMTSDLTFDDRKARNAIGWAPRRVLDCFEIA